MELSPRLLKIASLVPKGARIADVGTDHGYIPLYLFQNNIIKSAIAMDINPMPLKRAEVNLTRAGFDANCDFRLSNGLEKLNPGEADVIVIAGMGGILMQDILSRGKNVITPDTKLILQPMIAPVELRGYLFNNGFAIENDYVVREENKFYNIMCVVAGKKVPDDEEIYIGKNLSENSPEVFGDYINYRLKVCTNIIDGIQKSKNPDMNELKKYQKQYDIYSKYAK
ncbi:MAG: SAM-dependent methyltransferase [Clostridia bacterium]|nr:SAM-dependent methyltransferase [Clostridia bacterium]